MILLPPLNKSKYLNGDRTTRNKLTVDQGRFTLGFFPATSAPQLADTCRPRMSCPDQGSRFRTIDGSCNNLQRPELGQINTALQRIIPPKYGDGGCCPTKSIII